MKKLHVEPSSKNPAVHSNPDPEEIARRAYQLWEERGHPHGSPDEDWHRAEQELRLRSDQHT
jgi:hypothetical protein